MFKHYLDLIPTISKKDGIELTKTSSAFLIFAFVNSYESEVLTWMHSFAV